MSDTFTVATFNLRKDMPYEFTQIRARRQKLVSEIIIASGASVIGTQELTRDMRRILSAHLPEYSFHGIGRNFDGCGEGCDVIIKKSDVEITDIKTFWLSSTPNKKGSRDNILLYPRICTTAVAMIKDRNRKLRIYNTHLDHISRRARERGIEQILYHISKESLPIILMGDLNATPDSDEIRMITNNCKRLHSAVDLELYTYTQRSIFGKRSLDYIFTTDEITCKSAYIICEKDCRTASDHYPVTAELFFK